MAINTLSKNSISIIVALLLVIILSESKLFFFFTESYLGRSILILILIFASYLNKILGIVCVFIIIIMFSSNKFLNFEGFDNNTNANAPGANGNGVNQPTSAPGANGSGVNQPTTTTTTSNNNQEPSKINVITSSNTNKKPASTTTNTAIEGFDLQSTENTIKRGKQSNSIQVSPYLKQSVDVAPYEGNIHANSFNEGFSLF